jgi:hypothetical protein
MRIQSCIFGWLILLAYLWLVPGIRAQTNTYVVVACSTTNSISFANGQLTQLMTVRPIAFVLEYEHSFRDGFFSFSLAWIFA